MCEKYLFVSIIVASYNYGRYLKANLESLINQTYKNIEIIVIDDGSTDNSLEIIKEYIKKDSRVKLLTHKNNRNRGLKISLQKALQIAKGEYVAFCESDDYWDIHHIEEKVKYLKENPEAEIVICDFTPFGQDKSSIEHYTLSDGLVRLFDYLKKLKKPKIIFYDTLKMWTFPTFSIVMVKTNRLLECNWEVPSKNGVDIWLWKQLMLTSKTGYVNKKLTFFRRSGESLVPESLIKESFSTDEYWAELEKVLEETIKKQPKTLQGLKYLIKNNLKMK